jgi:hypothetical protein
VCVCDDRTNQDVFFPVRHQDHPRSVQDGVFVCSHERFAKSEQAVAVFRAVVEIRSDRGVAGAPDPCEHSSSALQRNYTVKAVSSRHRTKESTYCALSGERSIIP